MAKTSERTTKDKPIRTDAPSESDLQSSKKPISNSKESGKQLLKGNGPSSGEKRKLLKG